MTFFQRRPESVDSVCSTSSCMDWAPTTKMSLF